jgi:Fe-S cluster assembly protein SufB
MRRLHPKFPTTSCSIASSAAFEREEAVALIVNGFCREVLHKLPMEFAVEAQKLIAISLEGSVG